LEPSRVVLMPNRMHGPPAHQLRRQGWQLLTSTAAVPGLDGLLSYGAGLLFRPDWGVSLSSRANPAAADLMRHAFADVPGNSSLARSWARCARHWPRGAQTQLLDLYPRLRLPVLPSSGFLMAYDDPVGLARELVAFCG